MGSARKTQAVPASSVSLERAGRLHRLVEFLGKGHRTRSQILSKLKIDIRTFYRDLELLRESRIEVALSSGKYCLSLPVATALVALPFPDPCLTLGEAQQLSKGRSKTHLKLRELLKQIVKSK